MLAKIRNLIHCLKMIGKLTLSGEDGLKEAAESLENIADYHQLKPTIPRSPQEFTLLTGSILPGEIRSPLILDFDENSDRLT